MPQSLSKVYTHITFSSKNREKIIDQNIQQSLFEYLGGICKGLECNPSRIVGLLSSKKHYICGKKVK